MTDLLCIWHADFNFVNPDPEYLKAWLPRLADMGYNAVLWEIEDKVQLETCADAIVPDAMSRETFRGILDQAEALGLESIPLLQTIGHAEYILMQEAYKHMRELPDHHDCYCTENPEVRTFLKDLIREYLNLFGKIRYFHLGGDEAYVFAQCPTCLAKAEAEGRNTVYAEHVMDIADPIREAGARAGIWCDMVMNHPEQMDAIPPELVIWDWNYWDVDGPMEALRVWGQGRITREELTDKVREEFPEIVGPDDKLRGFYTSDALKRMGFDVILCSAARSSGDSIFCPLTRLHAGNIAGAARKTAEAGLLGTCVTDWAIRINSWETHRSLLPIAPMILADPEAGVEETLAKTGEDLFGCDAALFIEALDLISQVDFPFSRAHSTGIQWDRLKDSLPAPRNYIRDMLEEWEEKGRLEKERAAIGDTIQQIAAGLEKLQAFAGQAAREKGLLEYWLQAAGFQLKQARLAQQIMNGDLTPEDAAGLRELKGEYEKFLGFDQTPESAAKNAGLVYDGLIEYVEKREE